MISKFFRRLLLLAVVIAGVANSAHACDPCSLYNASRIQGLVPDTFTFAVSEQNTRFDRPINTPENSTRNGEYVREFSTTQFSGSYDFDQEVGFQVTVPVITRVFDQFSNYRYDTKSDTGVGDLTIIGRYSPLNYRKDNWSVVSGFTYGVKLPTGDTGTLGDVTSEVQDEESHPHSALRHHTIASASGGRALTFGTGSIDYIVGANFFTRYQRVFLLTDAQYSIRTEGSFDYEFADDLVLSVGPGYYLALEHDQSVAARMTLTGEFKGADHLEGQKVNGSKFSNVYLGPEVLFSLSNSLSGQVGVDMRTTGEDAHSTVVPELRVRAALAYRFM